MRDSTVPRTQLRCSAEVLVSRSMNYSKIIQKTINEDREFKSALEIVKKNSNGKIWVAGSFIFRNLASATYGLPKPIFKDYDFIVEKNK